MRILVTGGLGKIGRRLCKKISHNHDIIILDKVDIPKIDNKNKKIYNNIKIIQGDIRYYDISNMENIDIIIHMAAQTSVERSIKYPEYDADNNIKGTLNILEGSRRLNIQNFIYISSAAVYGTPINLPIDEEHKTNPISPYGLSKLTGEKYSMLYHDLYKLPVVCLRLFNVYGFKNSNDSYSGVITKFIDKVKNNENPIIYGDGNQTRDFIYIDDVISVIIKSIENKRIAGNIINVGTGKPTKIYDLANIIIDINRKTKNKLKNKKLVPEFGPPKNGDIKDSYADVNKLENLFDFKSEFTLEKGLELLMAD